ncbi:MAG: THUMP-like domain-containing protein [Bacteroidia bacterium]
MQKYNLLPEHLNFNIKIFVHKHLNDEIHTLALKYNKQTNFNTNLVLETIANFKKASYKLPTFITNYCWLPTKSYEQASSELTAFYKSSFCIGDSMLDLCGGLGVDDIAFSKVFSKVISLDADEELNEIVNCNFNKIGIQNIERKTIYAEDFLANNTSKFDFIYIDADRRPGSTSKKFLLTDCTPNILELLPQIKKITNHLLIKLSPMVDLDYCKSAIENIKEIHVVSLKNEVKEVLLLVDFTQNNITITKAVNIINEQDIQVFSNVNSVINEETPIVENQYFYEPNASIIKANLSANYAQSLGLKMIATNSNFFVGNKYIENFHGRSFTIVESFLFSKSQLKNYLKSKSILKANISKRNFPINEAEIAKQFNLKDGGNEYLFFTQNSKNEKLFFHCQKFVH